MVEGPDGVASADGEGQVSGPRLVADPDCPLGQVHELANDEWAIHPVTLAEVEAGTLDVVACFTYRSEAIGAVGRFKAGWS